MSSWYDYLTFNPIKYAYEGATGHGWGLSNGNLYNGTGSQLLNSLEGNPTGVSASLQQLANQAYGQGQQVKNFLLGREGNAEQYYRPMQQMFGQMYGTGGVMPGKAPQGPGSPLGGGGGSGLP